MPYFIATVWTMSDVLGDEPFHGREVRRHEADDEVAFRKIITTEDANDECIIGPVGLSKDQNTYERDYRK